MNSLARTNTDLSSLIENFRMGGPLGRDLSNFFSNGLNTFSNVPAVNVVENKDGFRIEVAAPGLKKEDFKLNLNHSNLTISTTQENQKEEKEGEKYTRREFSYASFQRTFTLPTSVDPEAIKASYNNGVLAIELPKREEAKVKPTRQIEIG